ncbi:S8 family serine peptidase [Streptomyces sp. NPDC086147]|uniref:S8 family serine peptidase n=1 Tax=Streptomyces sp. NPDC086147 TaxID=3155295 RepID=UPI00344E89BE
MLTADRRGSAPVGRALEEPAEENGPLFAVAAGDAGPGSSTARLPAATDETLAEAAADSAGADVGTPFSGRSPRVGDTGMKPQTATPDVAVTVSGSSAMTAFTPGLRYTMTSGASTAGPQAVGMAALLPQEAAVNETTRRSPRTSSPAPLPGPVAPGPGRTVPGTKANRSARRKAAVRSTRRRGSCGRAPLPTGRDGLIPRTPVLHSSGFSIRP